MLFNETGIDKTIIAELIFLDRIYTINHALDVKIIAHLIKHGELSNDLGYHPITKWIHLRDEASKLRKHKRGLKIAIIVFCLFIFAFLVAERCN